MASGGPTPYPFGAQVGQAGRRFAWPQVDSGKMALPGPPPQAAIPRVPPNYGGWRGGKPNR